MNLNKVFLIGNLTRDPELRTMPNGQPVVNFGIATNRVWRGKDGTQQKQVEFHNIVMFARLAEIAKQYLQKGSLVMIEGRLSTRSWEGQDGQKKQKTEIVAAGMQLGPRFQGGAAGTARGNPVEKNEQPKNTQPEDIATVEYPEDEINPDNIPF